MLLATLTPFKPAGGAGSVFHGRLGVAGVSAGLDIICLCINCHHPSQCAVELVLVGGRLVALLVPLVPLPLEWAPASEVNDLQPLQLRWQLSTHQHFCTAHRQLLGRGQPAAKAGITHQHRELNRLCTLLSLRSLLSGINLIQAAARLNRGCGGRGGGLALLCLLIAISSAFRSRLAGLALSCTLKWLGWSE